MVAMSLTGRCCATHPERLSGIGHRYYGNSKLEMARSSSQSRAVKLLGCTGDVSIMRPLLASNLRDTLYFGPDEHLHAKQERSTPVLLVSGRDLQKLIEDTHPGAFGDDYGTNMWLRPSGRAFRPREQWYAVWKFPSDMFSAVDEGVARVHPIHVPLPVGSYAMTPDKWNVHAPPCATRGEMVKWRIGSGLRGIPDVHFLSDGSRRLAAISSMYWFGDFWSTRQSEEQGVQRMLARLRRVGVEAFSCHGQHHAIVFCHSPEDLAARLRTDDRMCRALSGPSDPLRLRGWCEAYATLFD